MIPVRYVLLMLAMAGTFHTRAEDLMAARHFTEKVKPLLDSRCISCHGPDKVKGGLRLDSRAAVLKGGENGAAVIPGKPADSLLLLSVMHSKKDLEMPPKDKLTSNDIAVLKVWIEQGAFWPETATNAMVATPLKPGERLGDAWHDPRNPIVRIFGGQRLDLWSLKPVQRVEPPKLVISESVISKVAREPKGAVSLNTDSLITDYWIRNPIDNFVLAKLEAAKLRPAAEADKRTLARRLYFDLIGLPPTPEEINFFLSLLIRE